MADEEIKTGDAPVHVGEVPADSPAPESTDPPKKRRGRPPKNATLNAENPGSAGSGESAAPKRRAKASGEKLAAMAKQIQGLHLFVAMGTGVPELQITEAEAGMLASAMSEVAAEYGLSVDGKTGAALQLFGAAAMVYAPRYLAFRKRVAREASAPGTIVDMPQNGSASSSAH